MLLLLLLPGLRLAHWYIPTLPDMAVLVTVLLCGRGGGEEGDTPTAMMALTAGGMPEVTHSKELRSGYGEVHSRQHFAQNYG